MYLHKESSIRLLSATLFIYISLLSSTTAFLFPPSFVVKHFQNSKQIAFDSEDKNSLQNIESHLNDIGRIERSKIVDYAADGEKLTRDDFDLYPIESFLPKASIFGGNENQMIKNVRKKSRNNAMFNPFETRRMNQWKYANEARVPEKQVKSVRKPLSLMFPIIPYAETRFTKNWKLSNGYKLNSVDKERYSRHTHEGHKNNNLKSIMGRMIHRVICKPEPYNICYCTDDFGNINHLRNKRLMRVLRIHKRNF